MAILTCNYDLDNDTLYSVKWYKGKHEFFRYTPKEIPAFKIFPCQGVNVNSFLTNETHLALQDLRRSSSGKYSCEVSADAPSFQTIVKSKDLKVVG